MYGTYPPGEQVKAEFVFTGAQINDALERETGRQSEHSQAVPKGRPEMHTEAEKQSGNDRTLPNPLP